MFLLFKMILTKNELNDPEQKVWVEIVGKIDKTTANGDISDLINLI